MTAYPRSISEPLSASDTLSRHTTTRRSPIEEAGVSDAPTRVVAYHRQPVQSAPGSGVLTSPMLLFTRGQIVTGEVAPTVGQAVSPMLLFTTSGAADTVVRQTTAARTSIEVGTGVLVSPMLLFTVPSWATNDTTARQTSVHRADVETLTTADVPVRIAGARRGATESLTTADSPIRRLNARRQFADSLTYYTGMPLLFMSRYMDVVTRGASHPRGISEPLATSDGVLRHYTGARLNAESLATSDALTRRLTAIRREQETLSTGDTVVRLPHFSRTLLESLITADVVNRGHGLSRVVVEAARSYGSAYLPLLFTTPMIGTFDVLTTQAAHPRQLVEHLTTGDVLAALYTFMAVMGWVWSDAAGNAIADLPDWGYLLIEDPVSGVILAEAPIPSGQVNFTNEKSSLVMPAPIVTTTRKARGAGPR